MVAADFSLVLGSRCTISPKLPSPHFRHRCAAPVFCAGQDRDIVLAFLPLPW